MIKGMIGCSNLLSWRGITGGGFRAFMVLVLGAF
jgi:hypothetical protein